MKIFWILLKQKIFQTTALKKLMIISINDLKQFNYGNKNFEF